MKLRKIITTNFCKLNIGLYSGAIMQSGSNLAYWALGKNVRQAAFKVGDVLGIKATSSKDLLARLRNVTADSLVKAANTISNTVSIKVPKQLCIF